MKATKLVKMLGVFGILSFVILGGVSCNNGNSDSTDEDDKDKTDSELVLFDPAKYDGKTKEIGGELFAEITVNGYDTVLDIATPVDCSKVKTFTTKACGAEANKDFHLNIAVKEKRESDDKLLDISNLVKYELPAEPVDISAEFATKTNWNELSENKLATNIQPMVQDSSDGYKAQSDVVIYLAKVVAK